MNKKKIKKSGLKYCQAVVIVLILFSLIPGSESLCYISRTATTESLPFSGTYVPVPDAFDCYTSNEFSYFVVGSQQLQDLFNEVWIEVTINEVGEIDDLDGLPLQGGCDFYAKITIEGEEWTSSIHKNNDHPRPYWTLAKPTTESSVNYSIEVWENDLTGPEMVDISPRVGVRSLSGSLDISEVQTYSNPVVENFVSEGKGSDFRGKINYTLKAYSTVQKNAETRSALCRYYGNTLWYLRTCGAKELSEQLKYQQEHAAKNVADLISLGFSLGGMTSAAETPARALMGNITTLKGFDSNFGGGILWEVIARARYCTMWGYYTRAYGNPLYDHSEPVMSMLIDLSDLASQEASLYSSRDIKGLQDKLLEELEKIDALSKMGLINADAELLDSWAKFTETCDTKYKIPPGWKKNNPAWWEFWVPPCEPKPLGDAPFAPTKEVIQWSRDYVFLLQDYVNTNRDYIKWLYDKIKDYQFPVGLVVSSEGLPDDLSYTFYYSTTENEYDESKILKGGEIWNSETDGIVFKPGTTVYFKLEPQYIQYPEKNGTRYKVGDIQSSVSVKSSSPHIVVVFVKQFKFSVQTDHSQSIDADPRYGFSPGWYDAGSIVYASIKEDVVYKSESNDTRYVFDKWQGDAEGKNFKQSDPIELDQPKKAVATWSTEYRLKVDTSGLMGTYEGDWIGGPSIRGATNIYINEEPAATGITDGLFFNTWYPEGTTISLAIDPDISPLPRWRFHFTGWSGSNIEINTVISITMDSPKFITANYQLQVNVSFVTSGLPSSIEAILYLEYSSYTDVSVSREEKIWPSTPYCLWVDIDAELTATISPESISYGDYTYTFEKWQSIGGRVYKNPSLYDYMRGPYTFIAVYKTLRQTYDVTINVSGIQDSHYVNVYVDESFRGSFPSKGSIILTFYLGDTHKIKVEEIIPSKPGMRYRLDSPPAEVSKKATLTFYYVQECELTLFTEGLSESKAEVTLNSEPFIKINDNFLNGWRLWVQVGTDLSTLAVYAPPGYVIINELPEKIEMFTPFTVIIEFAVAQDFELNPDSSTKSVFIGDDVDFIITLHPLNGFNGPVTVEISELPPEVKYEFLPQMSVEISENMSAEVIVRLKPEKVGVVPFIVTAKAECCTHSVKLALIINQVPSFTLSVRPDSLSLPIGGSREATIAVESKNGFQGLVNLELSDLPEGIGSILIPATIDLASGCTGTCTLFLTAEDTVREGQYLLIISGEHENVTHTAQAEIVLFRARDEEGQQGETSPTTDEEGERGRFFPFLHSAAGVVVITITAAIVIIIVLLVLKRKRKK